MHSIEPFFLWRDQYNSALDERSPFYGREYSEMYFTNKIYNHLIHPQWDEFGSDTLFLKILFVDYEDSFAIIEFIGEWNDCLYNDIMVLKREIIDLLIADGINHFILIGENVLNFHASDDAYYEEWLEDTEGGWIAFVNLHPHVIHEMKAYRLHHYVHIDGQLNDLSWRNLKPIDLFTAIDKMVNGHFLL